MNTSGPSRKRFPGIPRIALLRTLFPGLLILLLFMMKPAESCFGQNPFTSSSEKNGTEATIVPDPDPNQQQMQKQEVKEGGEEETSSGFPLLSSVASRLRSLQRRFHNSLSKAMTEVKNDSDPRLLISLIAAAFMYGLVHALGPGHRKTVLASLFASGRYGSKEALIAGMGFALLHGGSAIVLLLTIYAFLSGPVSAGMEEAGAVLEKGSFLILALVGLWMIISAVKEVLENRKAEKAGRRRKRRYAIPMVIAAGLVPCPGAALILSFAIVYQVLPLGITAVIAMSVGMGTALCTIAAATGKAGRLITRMGSSTGKAETIGQALELAGGVLITLFAVSMFLMLS